MNNNEIASSAYSAEWYEPRARRMDRRAMIYTLMGALLLVAVLIYAFIDNRRPVDLTGADDYPTAYSALSGSDAPVSSGDVAAKAEKYIEIFRRTDRVYFYEYWLQCQQLLEKEPGYAPDAELTAQARADYERYVLLIRTADEEHRAATERMIVCCILAAAGMLVAVLLGCNRFRRILLTKRLEDELREIIDGGNAVTMPDTCALLPPENTDGAAEQETE